MAPCLEETCCIFSCYFFFRLFFVSAFGFVKPTNADPGSQNNVGYILQKELAGQHKTEAMENNRVNLSDDNVSSSNTSRATDVQVSIIMQFLCYLLLF